MKALVYQGKIVQIAAAEFEVHPNYTWHDVPAECTEQWIVTDGVISAPAPVVLSNAQIKAQYQAAVEQVLFNKARERDYDNALSIASYANSSNLTWQAESLAFIAWRDLVYQYALNILTDVENGQPVPELSVFIAGLPALTWPI